MKMEQTYYVVRMGINQYSWARGDDGEAQLLVFADHDEALDKARRVGAGTMVEHKYLREVASLARSLGMKRLLIFEETGGRTVVDVESPDF